MMQFVFSMRVPVSDARAAVTGRLVSRGFRLTGPRRAVLDVLLDRSEPLSVAQIHARLRDGRINLVSVYRTVHLLSDLGVVRVADASTGSQRFELSGEFTRHHHHLICQRCGRIEDLEGCLLEEVLEALNRRVRRSNGFQVTDHDVRLLGVCGRCASA
jgi:Fur family ferric uptake transcriptional regulator